MQMHFLDMLNIGKVQIANVCESTKSDPELNITDPFWFGSLLYTVMKMTEILDRNGLAKYVIDGQINTLAVDLSRHNNVHTQAPRLHAIS